MCVELHLFSLWLPQLLPQWSTIWATSPPNCWYTLHPDDICNVQKSCTSIDDCIKKPWKDSYSPKVHSCTPPKSNIDTKNDCLENVSPFKHGYFGYLCSILGGVPTCPFFLFLFFCVRFYTDTFPPPRDGINSEVKNDFRLPKKSKDEEQSRPIQELQRQIQVRGIPGEKRRKSETPWGPKTNPGLRVMEKNMK